MIATQFKIRAQLLKGDLPKSGSTPLAAKPIRPPPGLPVPPHLGGVPVQKNAKEGEGTDGEIVDTVKQLRASILGCHRETVRRDTGLENCPSSNIHHFVPQQPHSRHELSPPALMTTLKRGNT